MKKSYILFISLLALVFSGCSKDYLNTAPTSDIASTAIFENTNNMKMAVNGLNKLFCKQWLGTQGWNGQGTVMLYHGEYPGDELTVYLTGWTNTICGKYHTSDNSIYDYGPWHIYYMVIGNANSILAGLETATESTPGDKAFIEAQARTYRAYCYYYLLQLYAKRWIDSNDGAAPGVVLRLDESTGDLALSTQKQCYDQIYDDLNIAINKFKESKQDRTNKYEMGIDVAYALYSRVALAREDWDTAYTMASVILDENKYPLMSVAEYNSGFCTANKEWIWYLVGLETETLYYYSFAAYVAYNAQASQVRSYPKCISKQVFVQMRDNDIRKKLFLDPGDMSYTTSSGKADPTKNKELYDYGYKYASMDGRKGFPVNTFSIFAYMQFKFGTDIQVGITDVPLFRTSEVLLNRAEAAYKLGKTTEAQKDLNTLNNYNAKEGKADLTMARIPDYKCTLTGDELYNEIKLYRRIELWGEGFNWFDLKRWGDTIERKNFKNGGSFFDAVAITIGPKDMNEWTWVIPKKEKDYNHAL
ncbi:MAG: RagB/SusD family nutrient uptake outer membrane protein [Bacteroidales bacterium]|nr:RagB/SusD family nutrient uptake outer membrane protein [Candidatus Egerieousia equi]